MIPVRPRLLTQIGERSAASLISFGTSGCAYCGLHSAVGFVMPADMLAVRQAEILAARDRKLEEAPIASGGVNPEELE